MTNVFKVGLYLNDLAIIKFTKFLYFSFTLQFTNHVGYGVRSLTLYHDERYFHAKQKRFSFPRIRPFDM